MSQIVGDGFNGMPGQTLQAYNPSWVKTVNTPGDALISDDGQVRNGGGATSGYYRADAAITDADYSVSAEITSGSAIIGVTARTQASAVTFYQARISGNTLELYRFAAGAGTLMTSAATGRTGVQTYVVKLEVVGTSIRVYLDGATTPLLTANNASITAAGFPGIRSGTGTGSLDNFSADTIGSAGVSGALGAALPSGGIASAGVAQVAGSLSTQAVSMTLTAAGACGVAGSAAFVAPSPFVDGVGSAVVSGKAAAVLDSVAAGAGYLAVTGTMAAMLPPPVAAGRGLVEEHGATAPVEPVVGRLTAQVAEITLVAAGLAIAGGGGDMSVAPGSCAATGAVRAAGQLDGILQASAASAAGRIDAAGLMKATLGETTLSASGSMFVYQRSQERTYSVRPQIRTWRVARQDRTYRVKK